MGLTVLFAISLIFLLWVAKTNKKLYALAKAISSLLFLLCGLRPVFLGEGKVTAGYALLLAGLAFCAFGDVFLGLANSVQNKVSKRPFLAGAFSFTAAHVLFLAMMLIKTPFAWHNLVLPIIMVAVLALLEKKDKIRLKKMRPLAYLYTVVVSMMAGKAVMMLPGAAPVSGDLALFVTGAVLFFISDVILLFLYFGTNRKKYFRGFNLVSYYVGVYMMAMSAPLFMAG
ncbi:lysoplasmalogenase [Clostridia bacterium OttesenSCG-928-O13]|nr:lysoplasmalogenase [Clostridia bacterium OttesenSCG-928-O13]